MHDLPTMHASRATTASSSIINKRMNNNGRNGRMNEGKEQEEKDVGFNESIISKLYFKYPTHFLLMLFIIVIFHFFNFFFIISILFYFTSLLFYYRILLCYNYSKIDYK